LTTESNPSDGFPWVVYDNKEVNIPLLKNIMGASTTQRVVPTFGILIAEALNKITKSQTKKIAVIKETVNAGYFDG
jgi:hypothetical protein